MKQNLKKKWTESNNQIMAGFDDTNGVDLHLSRSGLLVLGGVVLGIGIGLCRKLSFRSQKEDSTPRYGEDRYLNQMISDVSNDQSSVYVDNPNPS